MFRKLTLIFVLTSCGIAYGQYAAANPQWNQPFEPVQIVGNLYYVGASDVSSYVIATRDGLILLDTGFRETVPQIDANLKKLGFRVEDVRLLLISHGHFDHTGGMADIKARTKAHLLASPAEKVLLERGGKGDFAFGDSVPYPPVKVDALLEDGKGVSFGGVTLTPHFTPGHTKGCTTWTTTVQEAGRTYRVVFPCSVTAPGYRLIDNVQYPQILADYEATFAKLRALPCDIFLGGHSWDFGLKEKLTEVLKPAQARSRLERGTETQRGTEKNPFVDPDGYRAYLDRGQAAIRKQAEEQRRK